MISLQFTWLLLVDLGQMNITMHYSFVEVIKLVVYAVV